MKSIGMTKPTRRDHGLLDGETHTSRLKRLYGDQLGNEAKVVLDTTLAKQSRRLVKTVTSSVEQIKNLKDEQAST